jgi:glycosyltransferase involved in cell wall biosynthesis
VKSAIRVLHLIPSLGGGGAERQCCLLAREQALNGLQVHVASVAGGSYVPLLKESPATVHRLPAVGNHDPLLLLRLARLIRSLRPDIVQTWLLQMDILGGLAAMGCGAAWVMTERASEPHYRESLKGAARRGLGQHADAVVANSVRGAWYWERRGATRPRTYVIPNGVPLDDIADAPAVAIAEVPEHAPIILFAGRLVDQKNLLVMLEGIGRVLATTGAHAVVCGEGPAHARLLEAIRANGLAGRVHLVGFREDFWSVLKSAVAFVSVSLYEGRPNTILEAMAAECPLVVSDIPEHREFLDADVAWLVDPTDPQAIAAALHHVLADPSEAKERSARARQRVAAFSLASSQAHYHAVYEDVLRQRAD